MGVGFRRQEEASAGIEAVLFLHILEERGWGPLKGFPRARYPQCEVQGWRVDG